MQEQKVEAVLKSFIAGQCEKVHIKISLEQLQDVKSHLRT